MLPGNISKEIMTCLCAEIPFVDVPDDLDLSTERNGIIWKQLEASVQSKLLRDGEESSSVGDSPESTTDDTIDILNYASSASMRQTIQPSVPSATTEPDTPVNDENPFQNMGDPFSDDENKRP
jgi:GTPase SAR1 family protein